MAQTLQQQIDDLRDRVVLLQNAIALRAKKTDIATMNEELGTGLNDLVEHVNSLADAVREIQMDLLEAREDLRDHTH